MENLIWIEPHLEGHLSYKATFSVPEVTSQYKFDYIL